MEVLNVKNLRKSFGSVEVLKGINLTLERGEVLSIIGSSGGGKTTFLRCLNFLELADEGEIAVNGETVYSATAGEKPIMTPEAQLSLGLVFQQFNLFPQYTVKGNLTLAPTLRAKRAKLPNLSEVLAEIDRRADELLETSALGHITDYDDLLGMYLSTYAYDSRSFFVSSVHTSSISGNIFFRHSSTPPKGWYGASL